MRAFRGRPHESHRRAPGTTSLAVVVGTEWPAEGVYLDPEPVGGHRLVSVWLRDWRDLDEGDDGQVWCVSCLVDEHAELVEGFRLAERHGGSWRYDAGADEWGHVADD